MRIRCAVVIGSGVMGSGIAATLSGSGIKVKLIDIIPSLSENDSAKGLSLKSQSHRDKLATQAINKQLKSRMSGFYCQSDAKLVTPGNLEDDHQAIAEADWIIEVVTENLDIKKKVFDLVENLRHDKAIVSSNTSGIPLKLLTAGRSDSFKQHFLITHFFNPPRFMHLLELVRNNETLEDVFQNLKSFAEDKLGKGVVDCKDTPGFIANRIGCFDLLIATKIAEEMQFSPAETDLLTGPFIGRPKSGTYRLLDVIGLDTISFVIANLGQSLPHDESKELFQVPPSIKAMIDAGHLGEKTKKGFFCKKGKEIQEINFKTLEYNSIATDTLKTALKPHKKNTDTKARISALLQGDDRVCNYLWKVLSATCCYAVNRLGEIADMPYQVDRAMCWGYRHEMGPFQIIDSLGVDAFCQKLSATGANIPELLKKMQTAGIDTFYSRQKGQELCLDPNTLTYIEQERPRGFIDLQDYKDDGKVICIKTDVTAIDVGGGTILLELHGKRNSLNMKLVSDITALIKSASENYNSVVIATAQNDFSVGADLKEMIGAAQAGKLDEFMAAITAFQEMSMAIKHSPIPVVCALRGFTFGGGCEVAIHCDAMQVGPEAYMGLVEAGVGLLPAGGGCKELAQRADQSYEKIYQAFEHVAMAKVSPSGREIFNTPYSNANCGQSLNDDCLIHDAILRAQLLASQGYRPPSRDDMIKVCGRDALAELRVRLNIMVKSGFVSEHDALIANKIAFVLCGGELPPGSEVSQDYLLRLEREAFLALLNEAKTQERIQFTLTNGKPLRN